MLRDLHLIEDFPFSEELACYLSEVVEAFSIISVELCGSYARGEQLNCDDYNSDIELLVFFQGREPYPCNVPWVDIDFIDFDKRLELDRTFFLYDFTQTSRLIFGEKSSVQKFGFSEVETWSIDEIILWRLYAVAKAQTSGEKIVRGTLQRNLDYLVTFQLLKAGYYMPTMAKRRAFFAEELANAETSELLFCMEARELATTAELLEVFTENLPDGRLLFRKVSPKDRRRNTMRSLRALSFGKLLNRRRLIYNLRKSLSFKSPSNTAIDDVEAYYKAFVLRL